MEGKIKSFADLVAWQEAHRLVIIIYRITNVFPKAEIFGLTNQMRRAVISISSNIAEGFGRETNKDKCHFYIIARTSLVEIQNQLLAARDIGYLDQKNFDSAANKTIIVHKLINGLIKKIKY
ncbi:MAG: four helix bundle protein [Patescibacteria group bacterium]|nr:four helix bundle protein [Patescibacteria group bacterium]